MGDNLVRVEGSVCGLVGNRIGDMKGLIGPTLATLDLREMKYLRPLESRHLCKTVNNCVCTGP